MAARLGAGVRIANPAYGCEARPMSSQVAAIDTHPEPTSRMLGKWMSMAMVVGSMVGSGIYLLPTTLSRQRTIAVTCSTSWLRIVSGSVSGRAVTLAKIGTIGGSTTT